MIIDAHCHIWQRDMIPEKYWYALAGIIASNLPGSSLADIIQSEVMQRCMNAPADRLIREMEGAGIDKTVIFGMDLGLVLGEPKINNNESNKWIADSAKEYPDKLIPFYNIDPRRDHAPELLEQALTKLEMKGLKLYPPSGFLPDGEECYQLYKIAAEYNVPIITHIGYTIGLKGKTASLKYFDGPVTDFPKLRFSFAHFNNGIVEELLNFMFMKPKTYCDISAHGQVTMMNSPADFYRQLRSFMNHGGEATRIMFGSDWPITNLSRSLPSWVDTIQKLTGPKVTAQLKNMGYKKFRKKEIKQILGLNATQFLKI